MVKIEVFKMTYTDLNLNKKDTPKIRGFFGNKFRDIDYMHNHNEDNKLFYRYPLVQYKVIDNKPIVIGINEGAEALKTNNIFLEDELLIGDTVVSSSQQSIFNEQLSLGETDKLHTYDFVSPWIALNQKNISKYIKSDEIDKEELLKSILIGNIISMCKGLGYTINDRIKIKLNLDETTVSLKGTKMLAFNGSFTVNFEIPDYFALGKSISRGFGIIKKVG